MGSDEIHIAQLPRPGDILENRYRLGKPFASGGMGVIMRAEQLRTGRDVAVKLLHPHIAAQKGFADRFKREVRVATLFDHQHIMRVYDVGQTPEGVLYLVMEYLEGEELKTLIEREAPLSVGRAGDIALQMLDGLAEAHSMNVVHRDFKPSNVFILETRRGDDHIKLLDFGIAKVINSQQPEITTTGEITGTPSYMAPETLLKKGQRDKKVVDVYGAGLVLLEMLTGKKSFQGEDITQTLLMQLKKPVLIPEPIEPTMLGTVVKRSTAKHPGDRYQNADEMFEALELALKQVPLDLTLEAEQIPGQAPNTSPSLLEEIASQDSDASLEMLRRAPQHESYAAGDTGPTVRKADGEQAESAPGSEETATRDVEPSSSLIERARRKTETITLEPDEIEIVNAPKGETTLAEETEQDALEETEEVPQALDTEERPGYLNVDEDTEESRPAAWEDPAVGEDTEESRPAAWEDPAVDEEAEFAPEGPKPGPPSREFQPPPGASSPSGARGPEKTAPAKPDAEGSALDTPEPNQFPIWVPAGIVITLLLGVGGWAFLADGEQPAVTASTDAGREAADVQRNVAGQDVGTDAGETTGEVGELTQFVLSVAPAEAEVTRSNGEVLGKGEVTLELPAEELPLTVTIDHDGYEPRELDLTEEGPRQFDIELKEKKTVRERRPPRSPSKQPDRKRSRSGSRADREDSDSSRSGAGNSRERSPNDNSDDDIDKMVDELLPDG